MNTNVKINQGIYIYIDNEVTKEKKAKELIQDIKKSRLFVFEFESIPDFEYIENNAHNISMIIMDWYLWSEIENPNDEEKIKLKNQLINKTGGEQNAKFIKKVLNCNIPIVIFSKASDKEIKDILIDNEIISSDLEEQPLILIMDKNTKIDNIVDMWHKKIPTTLFFSRINDEINQAKSDFKKALIMSDNKWIKSIWDLICDDHRCKNKYNSAGESDKEKQLIVSSEFSKFIINGIFNRVRSIYDFKDKEYLDIISGLEDDESHIETILENSRYLVLDEKSKERIIPGDIFSDGNNYFVNVRAECDTARPEKGLVDLYLVEGIVKNKEEFLDKDKGFLGDYNEIRDKEYEITIPFICGKKIIIFNFKKLRICKFNAKNNKCELKESCICKSAIKRIGRILQPYSTKIQQKFSSFISRIGLDAVPQKLVKEKRVNPDI
jgi:hypothetical protein